MQTIFCSLHKILFRISLILYSGLLYLSAPFIMVYLKKRSAANPDYNLYWNERFGFKLANNALKPIIWIHAVSVGETRAIAKLVELITVNYPNYQLLITSMTPTGRKIAKQLYPQALLHYIPYDMPHALANFYQAFKPKIGVIMETEIWPNMIFYADRFNIPLLLVNARLSSRSFKGYKKIKWLLFPILNKLRIILCQDEATATHFTKLGFNKETPIMGSTKFDLTVDNQSLITGAEIKHNIADKKVVVFSSTRDGEEKLILDNLPPSRDYLIIIVPRHPERFSQVEELIKQKNLKYQKRSEHSALREDTQIMLGDSLGEMFVYYAMADIAIIGGSFVNCGGQNLIEPLYLHKPVIFGSSMFNFTQIAANALADGCAVQVKDIVHCFTEINHILYDSHEYQLLSSNCEQFIKRYQGASQIVLDYMKNIIE